MQISLLNLNIWEGAFLDTVIDYIKKNDFDIVHLQEVSGGAMSRGGAGYYVHITDKNISIPTNAKNKGIDCFNNLQTLDQYEAKQVVTIRIKNDPLSYISNASLFKKSLTILDTKTIWHSKYKELKTYGKRDPALDPRASLAVLVQMKKKPIWFINTHLAWGTTPYDEDYKAEQADVLYNFIKNLEEPFVLSGDFNMTQDTNVVKKFSSLGKNLTTGNNILNTLNPTTHKLKKLFPEGLAVDYIITSQEVNIQRFEVIQEPTLSDHYGLTTSITV